jgi:hypothetical protein
MSFIDDQIKLLLQAAVFATPDKAAKLYADVDKLLKLKAAQE